MEYIQMTLDMWMETKRKLNAELLGVRRSFVKIGYLLRQIDESKGYENDGYKSIADFAKGEYGMEGSTVSRFMSINREYSIDGYSQELKPEYEDFKRSQLEEMLKLSEPDRKMITADTARADIRELKAFNKETPAAGEADDIDELIEQFFKDNKDELIRIYSSNNILDNTKQIVEIVNPAGTRSYRKGMYFLMMHENALKIKRFGGAPVDMTWDEFVTRMIKIFGEDFDPQIYGTHFGEEEASEQDNADVAADQREESKKTEDTPLAQEEEIHHDVEEAVDGHSETTGNTVCGEAGHKSDDSADETAETGYISTGESASVSERADSESRERPEEEHGTSENGTEGTEEVIAPAQNHKEILEVTDFESRKKDALKAVRQFEREISNDHYSDALRMMAGIREKLKELKDILHSTKGWS